MMEATKVTLSPAAKRFVVGEQPVVAEPAAKPKRKMVNRGISRRVLDVIQASPTQIFTKEQLAKQFGVPDQAISTAFYWLSKKGLIERVGQSMVRWHDPGQALMEQEEAREVDADFDFVGWLPDGRPLLRRIDSDELCYGTEQVVIRKVHRLVPVES